MGITGLLPLMKAATSDVKLEKLSGTVAAIDTNGWIHRACYSCGDKVYLNEETDMYINYCMNMCGLLKKHNITPILVFDGQSLPAKAETKAKRQKRKDEVRRKIDEMLRVGDNRNARWLMRQCVDVTFEMVHRVIQRCREERIDYIVAPFEADAQITYLVNHGVADYAITEDSDLLVFGCKKTLYKLDRENEKGSMLSLERINKCFNNFCERKFQYMCILSGCDYLANIPNVGLGRARKFFESITSPLSLETIQQYLVNLPSAINMPGKVKVTEEYIKGFVRAVRTFDHQLVFSPFTGNLTTLKNLKGGLSEHRELCLGEFAGDFFDDKTDDHFIIHYIAGNVHPKTLQKMDADFTPFSVDGSVDKFSWFADEIRQRVNGKKATISMVSSLFVPESPVKSTATETNRESKRKVRSSPVIGETPSPKRIKSVAKKNNQFVSTSSAVKQTQKSIIREQGDDDVEVVTTASNSTVEIATETNVVEMSPRKSRSSARNVFRLSETKLTEKVSNGLTSSSYFKKSEQSTSIDVHYSGETKPSPKEKSLTSFSVSSDSDSDFDELEYELPKKAKKPNANLNVSVSSIDEEDKNTLSSLNNSLNTPSSGYSSQPTAASSQSPSARSQYSAPQVSNAFTKLKSPNSKASSSSAKKSTTRTSKRTSSRKSATTTPSRANSITCSPGQDIRSFFSKRN